MNDQRATMPKFPGLHNSQEVLDQLMTNKSDDATHLDDGFFEMLMRCQVCCVLFIGNVILIIIR